MIYNLSQELHSYSCRRWRPNLDGKIETLPQHVSKALVPTFNMVGLRDIQFPRNAIFLAATGGGVKS